MSETTRKPFSPARANELADFIADCTGRAMDPHWAQFVLGDVVAGPEAVCDLWRRGQRVCLAVSVDAYEAEGNAAELSVFRAPNGGDDVLLTALSWGEARARAVGRANVDLPEWPGTTLPRARLGECGYQVHYALYHMRRSNAAGAPPAARRPLPSALRWDIASREHAQVYYDTLRAAFAGLPSTFVSPFELFAERLERSDPRTALLLGPDPAAPCAGFVRVVRREDGSGQIASLGRHPHYRGAGLGDHLVRHGLDQLADLGCEDIDLEVVASNRAALGLYQSFGFAPARETAVYRKSLVG